MEFSSGHLPQCRLLNLWQVKLIASIHLLFFNLFFFFFFLFFNLKIGNTVPCSLLVISKTLISVSEFPWENYIELHSSLKK